MEGKGIRAVISAALAAFAVYCGKVSSLIDCSTVVGDTLYPIDNKTYYAIDNNTLIEV